jgi:hypothetical protein
VESKGGSVLKCEVARSSGKQGVSLRISVIHWVAMGSSMVAGDRSE